VVIGFWRHVVVLAFGGLVGLVGCVGPFGWRPSWRILSEAEARLGDAVLAVYVSPQSYNFQPEGYVLLINAAGSISAIRTSGMDIAALTWTGNGLFFADTQRDYLLTDTGLTAWPSPKTNVQEAAFAKPDGSGYLSLYNHGTDGQSYTEQLVDTTGTASTRYDVAGFNRLTSLCGTTMYGAAEATQPYTGPAQKMGAVESEDPPYWPDMLTQLYPKPATPQAGLKSILGFPGDTFSSPAPCRDGQILTISSAGGPRPTIVTWPVNGQPATSHPIVGPAGEPLGLSQDVGDYAKNADWSTADDELVWLGGDGIIRATNTTNGHSHNLWDSGTNFIGSAYNNAIFNNDTIYIFDTDNENAGHTRQMKLRSHNLTTGTTHNILTTQPGYTAINPNLAQRDIATRPSGHS
jgi:hypothetical protein